MSDEWDENEDTGKSFGRGSYQADDTATTAGNDSGWQGSSDNSFALKKGFRGGRGGFRGSRSSNGGFHSKDEDNIYEDAEDSHDKQYSRNGGDGGGDDREHGRGRGRGGGGRGGGRGGFNRRSNDESGNNDGGEDVVKTDKPRELYIPPAPTDNEDEIFGTSISSGINFDNFDKITVNVTGENAPAAITSFEQSGLREYLLNNVKKSGYKKPTPIQKNAIPIIMNKRDMMACAQTGSGKTAAFLLPIINCLLDESPDLSIGKPHVIIVSPTRELTIQIYNEARKFSMGTMLKICIAYGGTAVRHQGDSIAKGCHILVATPGRLLDFVERTFVTFEHVKFVVLDEADRMLDMGFMSSVEKMMTHTTMVPKDQRQTLMFSATFPAEIQVLAGQFLNEYVFVAVGIVGGASADVEQTLFQVTKFEKRKKLEQILEQNEPAGTLVFVETKRNADYLASLLSETKFPTTSIHGDRLQREREEALRDFKSGKMFILIATSVAARGLDIKNVSHVINYDLPKSIDDYVHRIGRTGRVGNKGKATSFYDPEQDAALAGDLVKILKQADQNVPDFLEGSYGGSYGGPKSFGARDIRDNGSKKVQPQLQEPDEDW